MKKIIIALVVILILSFFLTIGKDMILKMSVQKGIEFTTGLKARFGSFSAGMLKTFVHIKNMELYNTKDFKDPVMLSMPEIYVDYDLGSALKGVVHLEEVRLDLKEFIVIKNERGELNLNYLKVVRALKEGMRVEEKDAGKPPKVKIDTLELKIGRVLYKDYSAGHEPSVREFNVNLHEKFSNITNPYSIVSLVVVKTMSNTRIPALSGFDLKSLRETISDPLKTAEKVTSQVIAKTQETVKETVKNTTETIKNVFRISGEKIEATE